MSKANEAMKEAAEKDKETWKAEKDFAGRNPVDQVEPSQTGEKEAEKDQTGITIKKHRRNLSYDDAARGILAALALHIKGQRKPFHHHEGQAAWRLVPCAI